MTSTFPLALTLGAAAISPALMAQDQSFSGRIGKRLDDSVPSWPKVVKAPEGAPNVLWIILDDVGYGASSAFGGLIETPVMDSLARAGLCYTNFHTCALSAPTRAALLTGRNHHTVHVGNFSHTMRAAGFPGYDGYIPSECGTIAEVLRESGWNTFCLGKYGLTPDEEASNAGPFTHWPQGKGFEHFFGFICSSTDNYNPQLIDELNYVQPNGHHMSEQLTDRAIEYIDRQKEAAPSKPFFMYYSTTATHAPIQAPREWLLKYRGKFDEGWDVYREKVFEREKAMGTVPANAVLPPREEHIPAWDSLTEDQKFVCCRYMEAYAAFLSHCDYQIGRLLDHLREIGQLDNTIVITMIGDNGSSKAGHMFGTLHRDRKTWSALKFKNDDESVAYSLAHIDEIGTPSGKCCEFPLGWSQACDTPYRFWKGFADSEGGSRNPMIINWGTRLEHGIREQFCHVNDLMPTTLEMTGIEMPETIRGIKQKPLQGTSLVYTFDNPTAPERHTEQYFFVYSSRALYLDGWKLAKDHPMNLFGDEKGLTDDDREWRLYNLREDPTEMNDLSAEYPALVRKMLRRFDKISKRDNIYPYFQRVDINNGKVDRIKALTKEEKAHYKHLMGGEGFFETVPVYE